MVTVLTAPSRYLKAGTATVGVDAPASTPTVAVSKSFCRLNMNGMWTLPEAGLKLFLEEKSHSGGV